MPCSVPSRAFAHTICCTAFVASSCFNARCYGDLAFSPTGTDLFEGQYVDGRIDDRAVQRTTGLSNFRFFGRSLGSTIHVSENGNLSTTPNFAFFPHEIDNVSVQTKLIAPLWDDVFMVEPTLFPATTPKNYVLEQKLAGAYVVTWQNIRLLNETVAFSDGSTFIPDTIRSAQVALMGTAQSIRGFDFRPNDIVFSYQSFYGTTADFVDPIREGMETPGTYHLNATVGLVDSSTASHPSDTDYFYAELAVDGSNIDSDDSGYVESPEAASSTGGRLPWDNLEFVLYREQLDENGNFVDYNVTIERFTAVPEPSLTWLLLSTCGWLCLRRSKAE